MTFMKGEKCELRVLEATDEEAKAWAQGVNAGLTTRHLFSGSFPMRWIDVQKQWQKEREAGSVEFGVWTDGGFIGTCGLYSHRDIYRSWEFRILIFDANAVGKGVGTEATRMTVHYAFNRCNAHRVYLGVYADNERAVRCYQKVGFKEEGRLRDEIFCFGKYHDAIRMSILEDEWRAQNTVAPSSA